VSLIEPRPRIKTRQPVVASTRFSEFPRGPKILPTKLNCRIHRLLIRTIIRTGNISLLVCISNTHICTPVRMHLDCYIHWGTYQQELQCAVFSSLLSQLQSQEAHSNLHEELRPSADHTLQMKRILVLPFANQKPKCKGSVKSSPSMEKH